MAEITKPDFSKLWSSGGANVAPSNLKIETGWTAEVPPFQWENWSQNRQDQAIAHILQHGISVWDSITEYQASKSYVTGSDGNIYRAVITNTDNNPVTDLGTNWLKQGIFPLASTAQAQAQTSDTSLISPLKLAQAFQGSRQTLASPGFQKFPGGLIIQWGLTGGAASNVSTLATFPTTFPNAVYNVQLTYVDGLVSQPASRGAPAQVYTTTLSNFMYSHSGSVGNAQHFWFAIGS